MFLYILFFFFSSRRRHTRLCQVTGVPDVCSSDLKCRNEILENIADVFASNGQLRAYPARQRSEERRVGKECLTQCRSRWSPYLSKKKILAALALDEDFIQYTTATI